MSVDTRCFNCGTPYRGIHPEARADYEAAVDALAYLISTWEQGITPDIDRCRAVLRRLRDEVPA